MNFPKCPPELSVHKHINGEKVRDYVCTGPLGPGLHPKLSGQVTHNSPSILLSNINITDAWNHHKSINILKYPTYHET